MNRISSGAATDTIGNLLYSKSSSTPGNVRVSTLNCNSTGTWTGLDSVGHHGQGKVAVSNHANRPAALADHHGADIAVAHELAHMLQAVPALGRHDALGHHLGDAHAATVSETPYP